MDPIVRIIIYVVAFMCGAYILYWICKTFELPQPVLWIVGAILLIIALLSVNNYFGGHSHLPF